MRTIRASEIGVYLFCRRAWWYQGQGLISENQAELAAGTTLHQKHSRQVLASGLMRGLGYLLLLAALIALTYYLAGQFL
jgi:hypothetical protein